MCECGGSWREWRVIETLRRDGPQVLQHTLQADLLRQATTVHLSLTGSTTNRLQITPFTPTSAYNYCCLRLH